MNDKRIPIAIGAGVVVVLAAGGYLVARADSKSNKSALADEPTHFLGCIHVPAVLAGAAERSVEGGSGRDRVPLGVVDHLRIDMVLAAEHRQARALRRAGNLTPDPQLPPLSKLLSALHG